MKSGPGKSTNAVQSMLSLLNRLRPVPALDPFVLKSLSSNYNARCEVLLYLENHLQAQRRNGHNVDSSNELVRAIQGIYDELADVDTSLSISATVSSFSGTKYALSLDQYGLVNEANDAFMSLIERAGGGGEFVPPGRELDLWEDRWVAAQRELSQWSLVDEFATSSGDKPLMLEASWKLNDWGKVKALLATPSIVALTEEGDPLTKMHEIYLAIHDGSLDVVDGLQAQTSTLCLNKWQLLPQLSFSGSAHNGLLQQFQRIVELKETSQILHDVSSHAAQRTTPDLKGPLRSWQHRLPNSFESLSVWEDVFIWRCQIFDAVASNFSWSDPNTVASLQDKPFACIALARVARKQGLPEVAAHNISSISKHPMDVQDAFQRVREQISSFKSVSSQVETKSGLNLVNSTNLSYFDDRQKAEAFRLKAYFLDGCKDKPKANQAYCHAVQICPNYARAWTDWGRLCVSLCEVARSDSEEDRKKNISLYLSQAMGCYLEAVRCSADEHSREYLPACLSMLAHDGDTFGHLCQAFDTRSASVPAWVWLPWIPQLLSSLCRVEAPALKTVLSNILKDHPQAIYFQLRSAYFEKKSNEVKSRSRGDDDAQMSAKLTEILMSNLRRYHPTLWTRLELVLEDVSAPGCGLYPLLTITNDLSLLVPSIAHSTLQT